MGQFRSSRANQSYLLHLPSKPATSHTQALWDIRNHLEVEQSNRYRVGRDGLKFRVVYDKQFDKQSNQSVEDSRAWKACFGNAVAATDRVATKQLLVVTDENFKKFLKEMKKFPDGLKKRWNWNFSGSPTPSVLYLSCLTEPAGITAMISGISAIILFPLRGSDRRN